MLQKMTRLILLILVCGVCGCRSITDSVTGYPASPSDSASERKDLLSFFSESKIEKYNELPADSVTKRRALRDSIVYARMRYIDLNYYQFRKALLTGRNANDIMEAWATLGLSAASTVLPAAGTKTILSAISTGVQGASGAIDKNLYYDKTIIAIVSQMDSQRKGIKAQIVEQLLKASESAYPLMSALVDLDAYYEAGSLPNAVNSIVGTSSASSEKSDQQLKAAALGL